MFYDSENNHMENISELWVRYKRYLRNQLGLFSEEEICTIVDELDNRQQWKDALAFVNAMLSFYPQSSTLKIKKADILISTDEIDTAEKVLETLMTYEVNDVDYYLLRTEIDVIRNSRKAYQWLETASVYLSQDDYLDLIDELIELLQTYNQADLMFHCLRIWLQRKSYSTEIIRLFVEYTNKTRRYQESEKVYLTMIDHDPYNAEAWLGLGHTYIGMKSYKKAIDAYLYTVAIDEKHPSAHKHIASIYIKMRKYEKATEELLNQIGINKSDIQSLRSLGYCYLKIKSYGLARYYYQKALDKSPTAHAIIAEIAQTYLEQKTYTAALNILKKALVFDSSHAYYHYLVAHCQYQTKNYTAALKSFASALSLNLKRKEYWDGLLKTFVQLKEYDQLYAMSMHAMRHAQKNYFLYFKAYSEFKIGQKLPARQTLEKAINTCPKQYSKVASIIPLEEIREV